MRHSIRSLLLSLVGAAALVHCSSREVPPPTAEPVGKTLPDDRASAPIEGAPSPNEGEPDPAAGKRAPCTTDQSCNDDPSVSSLWGHCTERGVCECVPGFELSPTSKLCRPVQ